MSQRELYCLHQAQKANITLEDLGIEDFSFGAVSALQAKLKTKPDGWFGPKSIAKWKAWARKQAPKPQHSEEVGNGVVVDGVLHQPPEGVTVVPHTAPNGIPAQRNDTSPRRYEVTQFILHRGAETKRKSEATYAHSTERILDARGLSSTFTMDIDGTIYQHFDPAVRRGRHASHHNVQSDSIDIGGPFSQKRKPVEGQTKLKLKMAIGRSKSDAPPLSRKYGSVRCWSLTPAQEKALIAFVPWYCELRGIPLTACEDWRTFRVRGLGRKDPVTNVKGILAHTQISGPGRRVDGILPLKVLREGDTPIEWRSAENFFDT